MARILLVDDYQNAAESTALFLGMCGAHEGRAAGQHTAVLSTRGSKLM